MSETLLATEFYFPESPPDTEAAVRIRATPLYRELDRLAQEDGPSSALKQIVEVRSDPAQLETYSHWLRDRYMYGASPEALYGLHYFDALVALSNAGRTDLYDAPLQDTMLIMVFAFSELMAHENVARCEEQPNGTTYRSYWRTARRRGAYARQVWDAMSSQRQSFALRFALARVEHAEGRAPSTDACAAGIRAMQAAADAGLCRRLPVSDEKRAGYVGGSIAEFEFCDSRRFSTFVNDAAWIERRGEVRRRYWDQLFTTRSAP